MPKILKISHYLGKLNMPIDNIYINDYPLLCDIVSDYTRPKAKYILLWLYGV